MTRVRRPKDPTELSAAEWVRQQLIEDIVAGRLRPGEKLCEVKIASRLGCSRTPVREAFRHLGALGLANFEKNRGGNVVRLERAMMLELFEALAEVAAACAGLAASRAEAQRRSLAERDWPHAAAPAGSGGDDDLFSVLFGVCGNRLLSEAGATIRCRLLPYWRLLGKAAEEWPVHGAPGQAETVRAMAAGDGRASRRAMRAFVLMARDQAVRGLPCSVLP
ncbi:transcriptional regulator [Paramagnetospirillum caucaseum]|uniref:Transcriptional regulator n=1 Tax=Paramagnetospirillum caucaseum TaxID=1244869 RepID=M2YD07_9PROT|nr:GntR family transcriptional regulator [Paramagnetospirillum caucaseum]EME70881.1 transcriptional regulator [Paramagnetospirillum caucaseum]